MHNNDVLIYLLQTSPGVIYRKHQLDASYKSHGGGSLQFLIALFMHVISRVDLSQ